MTRAARPPLVSLHGYTGAALVRLSYYTTMQQDMTFNPIEDAAVTLIALFTIHVIGMFNPLEWAPLLTAAAQVLVSLTAAIKLTFDFWASYKRRKQRGSGNPTKSGRKGQK